MIKKKNRPELVTFGLYFLLGSVVLNALSSLLVVLTYEQDGYLMLYWLTMIGSTMLMLFMVYLVSIGKNWARITWLVIFILGFPSLSNKLRGIAESSFFAAYLIVFVYILLIIALIFLFQRKSSDWFKKRK